MAPRLLALAGACALSLAVTASAETGPGPGMPPPPPGMEPPALCAEDQKPTLEDPCMPPFEMPELGEDGFPGMPPFPCGGEEPPAELRETEAGEESEVPDMPPVDCLPMQSDMLDDPGFRPGFLKRAWRFDAEANGFDAEKAALDVTITKVRGLPKRFRDQDDALIDEFAYVLVGAKTKVFDARGDRLAAGERAGALEDADEVRAVGKLLSPDRWIEDEDTEPVATIRAKRIVIEG